MFGTDAVSDWKEGSPITWKGEWEGKHYEDRGVILRLEPERLRAIATSALFQGFRTDLKITTRLLSNSPVRESTHGYRFPRTIT